ncbi:MAG: hypothetical protein JWP39_1406, partial [Jatrophihabitans sp.]|nr:hypothetical protein [Jatrophihabitans sp.]
MTVGVGVEVGVRFALDFGDRDLLDDVDAWAVLVAEVVLVAVVVGFAAGVFGTGGRATGGSVAAAGLPITLITPLAPMTRNAGLPAGTMPS